jgi:phospholipid N-methyltransferase
MENNNRLHFLKEGIKNLRETGSIAASSKYLCKEIVSQINFNEAKVIVELGPGDGVITRYLLENLQPHTRLFVFEINDVFVEKLKKEFMGKQVTIIHDSAENMASHFIRLDVKAVDYFVSGIPFVMLPDIIAERVIHACLQCMRRGGKFVQFHYSPIMLRFYKRMFGNASVEFVPLNMPPAIVITCEKE